VFLSLNCKELEHVKVVFICLPILGRLEVDVFMGSRDPLVDAALDLLANVDLS
jgi:hypothetical protein